MIHKYKRGNETVEAIKLSEENASAINSFTDAVFVSVRDGRHYFTWDKNRWPVLEWGMVIVKDSEGIMSVWKEDNFNNVFQCV